MKSTFSQVQNQLTYLTSSERRILRNAHSANGRDEDISTVFARITSGSSGTGETAKGSATLARVRAVVNKMRDGTFKGFSSAV